MAEAEGTFVAEALDENNFAYPSNVREVLLKAKTSWLKNTEVCDVLENYVEYGLPVSREPPSRPPGGSIFLFDRKAVRFFRKDGHNWRKKSDGKTVRETHEKLKVGNVEMLNCYYAHSEREDGPQRRCYWLLESENDIVLVHYLVVDKNRLGGAGEQQPVAPETRRSSGGVLALPAQSSSGQGLQPQAGPVDSSMELVPGEEPEPEALMPSMSLDSFFAAFDDQDTAAQQLKQGQGDDLVDSILPSWDELIPSLGGQAGAFPPAGREWQVDREQDPGMLPTHVVHAGGSLRLIEPVDPGYQRGFPQDWSDQPTNVLGTRQMSHDARQSMRAQSNSFGRGTARLNFQDSLYTTKQEQLKMAAEAMQSAAAAMQGMAGSFAGIRPGMEPVAAGNPGFRRQLPYATELQQPALQSSAFATSRQQPATEHAFPAIPEMHGMVPDTGMLASPFGAPQEGMGHPEAAAGEGAQHQLEHARALQASHTGPGNAPKLGSRSISMELPSMSSGALGGRGVTWKDAASVGMAADHAEDIGGSKARRGAYAASKALALEAELSSLDREVMHHLRQPSGGLPVGMADEQVRVFEEHLHKLESASSQLLRNRSAPAPLIPEDLFLEGTEQGDAQDNTSSSMLGTRHDDAMEDTGSAPLPFEILDFTPDWDFTTGGAKLIVTCSFTDQTNLDVSNARLHVMFDNEQVLATVLRPGVIRVYVPPHDAGSVDLKLTFGDGKARSASCRFTYRIAPQALRGADNTVNVMLPDRELQHRLIRMLTGSGSQLSSEQDSGACSSGSGQHQPSAGQVTSHSDGALTAEANNLHTLSYEQCERLLLVLIERRVKLFIAEAAAREQVQAPGMMRPAEGRSSLDCLHNSGHAVIHMLAGLGYARALDMLVAARSSPSLKDAWGYTPLHWAAARSKAETVALLVARDADMEAVTYLTELHPRLTAADTAAGSGNRGIAAFLGEQQLQQSVLKLKEASTSSPVLDGRPAVSMQRKRSRHLPQPVEGQPDPLLDGNLARSPSSGDAVSGSAPAPQDNTHPATPTGKENVSDLASIISRAKQNAETLESAILRKAARRALRQEKRLRAQKRQLDALERIQARKKLWQQFQEWASSDMQRRQMQDPQTMRYLSLGARIDDIQQHLESLIRAHATSVEKLLTPPDLRQTEQVADYGSDSDITMSRSESINSQRRLQQMHNSRRLGSLNALPRTSDTDIRSILTAGGTTDLVSGLDKRSRSKSTISRALAHVERLRGDDRAKQEYQELKGALKAAATPHESSFKFART